MSMPTSPVQQAFGSLGGYFLTFYMHMYFMFCLLHIGGTVLRTAEIQVARWVRLDTDHLDLFSALPLRWEISDLTPRSYVLSVLLVQTCDILLKTDMNEWVWWARIGDHHFVKMHIAWNCWQLNDTSFACQYSCLLLAAITLQATREKSIRYDVQLSNWVFCDREHYVPCMILFYQTFLSVRHQLKIGLLQLKFMLHEGSETFRSFS